MADADILAAIGLAMFGERWHTGLAKEMHVKVRTVRRWAAGEPLSKSVAREIYDLALRRHAKLETAILAMRQIYPSGAGKHDQA